MNKSTLICKIVLRYSKDLPSWQLLCVAVPLVGHIPPLLSSLPLAEHFHHLMAHHQNFQLPAFVDVFQGGQQLVLQDQGVVWHDAIF